MIGGPIMFGLKWVDRRQTRQHDEGRAANQRELAEVGKKVEAVGGKVDQVSGQLNEHISWHLNEGTKSNAEVS